MGDLGKHGGIVGRGSEGRKGELRQSWWQGSRRLGRLRTGKTLGREF